MQGERRSNHIKARSLIRIITEYKQAIGKYTKMISGPPESIEESSRRLDDAVSDLENFFEEQHVYEKLNKEFKKIKKIGLATLCPNPTLEIYVTDPELAEDYKFKEKIMEILEEIDPDFDKVAIILYE